MSAYICSTNTFAALGTFAAQFHRGRRWVYPPQLFSAIKRHDYDYETLIPKLHGLMPEDMGIAEYATLVANILRDENIRSVKHRYQDCSPDELPGHSGTAPLNFDQGQPIPDPITILKACDCLEYQSCETGDWQESLACEVLNMIRKAAIKELPGYDDAPWGIE